MLKKIMLLLIFFGICGFCVIYFSGLDHSFKVVSSLSLSFAIICLCIDLLIIEAKESQIKKFKLGFLIISLLLLAISILSLYKKWPGGGTEGLIAVFSYCFAYAPLELYYKNAKWRPYSSNSWEMLLLSSIDFVGYNLVILGIITKILHWPGQLYLFYPGVGILIIGLFLWNTRFKQEVIRRKNSEDKIKMQYQEIEREKQRSDNLLLNILPAEVAEELKAKGSADAKQFDEVTVLFTDFQDFTKLSMKMTAKELLEEINTCFWAFDEIIEKYGIEKIKTIGDSYMCAGGLPVVNKTHAIDVVSAGLEIKNFILNHIAERTFSGKESFQIRIGIHTGPVVAGIVGAKKFAYDIWGDTVNTASRMESSGEAGKINISRTTYELVKDKFTCIHRGKIQTKGKGELDMYFLEEKI